MLAKRTAKRLWLAACLILTTTITLAQQHTVSGKILDANNQPASGATVTVKGTNVATQTDANGNFTLAVPAGRTTLTITNVGFEAQDVSIENQSTVTINLRSAASTLNEVVVTGYSSQAKRDITGSVAVVNVKELVANPGSNVQNLLQGRAAGVSVGTSGVPGAGANVRIHGYSTFGNNEPLYIVDGARVSSITELNPNDIETMQVLKDASAASIYGSAAAGGVIIITTKKGKQGRPRVTYDSYYGQQYFNKRLDLMNTTEYGDYLFLLQKNAGQLDSLGRFKHGQFAGPTGLSDHPIIPDYIYAGGGQPAGKTEAIYNR
jgi:TonB-dependent SusC/RagA subfamily outer membrane receptor